MSIEDYYTQTIIIERNTTAKSTMGSTVDSWATHLTILGCIRPKKGDEVVRNDMKEVISDYTLYCAVADILEKDRAKENSTVYDIIFVRNPMSRGHHLEIDLKKRL